MQWIRDLLRRILHADPSPGDEFQFGAGVIALAVRAFIALCVAVPAIFLALQTQPTLAFQAAELLGGVGLLVILGNWVFAAVFPDVAATGGLHYRKIRERQMMAALDHPTILEGEIVPDPQGHMKSPSGQAAPTAPEQTNGE